MVRFLEVQEHTLGDPAQRDQPLYWYVHTFLCARYAGFTETVLNQDLDLLDDPDHPLDNLVDRLRQNRGDLKIQANDFIGFSRGARIYPLLYMLTRAWKSPDWETGIELSGHLLARLSKLQIHHIFPKALLYQYGYDKREVNALANFTFLTQEAKLQVSDQDPAVYLARYAQKNPQLLKSHWSPMDPALWKIENYLDFLEARRKLLAEAANDFLAQELGLAAGRIMCELVDDEGDPLALVDLAWPDGVQEGLTEPVAVLVNEEKETEEIVGKAGFRFFTSVEDFKAYVAEEIRASEAVS
jgi:hypothetical protein